MVTTVPSLFTIDIFKMDIYFLFLLEEQTSKPARPLLTWGIPIAYMVLYKDILSFATWLSDSVLVNVSVHFGKINFLSSELVTNNVSSDSLYSDGCTHWSNKAQEAIFSKTIGYGYQLYCWPQEAIDIGLGKIGNYQEVGKEV